MSNTLTSKEQETIMKELRRSEKRLISIRDLNVRRGTANASDHSFITAKGKLIGQLELSHELGLGEAELSEFDWIYRG